MPWARPGRGAARPSSWRARPGWARRLLRAATRAAAESGFTCLRARAGELERDFAYGCVRQLLEPAVATAPDPERLFEGAAALSRPLFAPSAAALPSPSADSTFAVLHGLYWLLNNLAADAPVALSVDDLHWSDAESLRLLAYLAPRLEGLPVAVLASTRPGEGLTADLARLVAAPEITVLRPAPLSIAATATLCEQRLGSPVADDFAAACREAAGGNPFFLEALLREAREQRLSTDSREAARVQRLGPAAVAQAVLLRLSGPRVRDRPRARRRGAGRRRRAGRSCAPCRTSEDEAARAADVLVDRAILRPAAALEFAHPIVREAVYADMGSHERARAHARAAEILAASGASEERIAAQIADARPSGDPDGSSSCGGWPRMLWGAERRRPPWPS